MNKVFQVNIGGMVFSVDDLAFERLSNYLESLRRHFNNTDGKDEIISDIESRIAEILKERLKAGKEIVGMEDVQYIISVMGNPEELSSDEDEGAQNAGPKYDYTYPGNTGFSRRLFRNPDDKILGGVCSGLSLYFGISQPIWLRLAFALAFFTFGSGFLLYIILWIVIPKAKTITDKMEMHGQDINIHNIKKNFSDDVKDLKEEFKNFKNPNYKSNFNNSSHRFFNFLHDFFYLVGHVFIKIVAWVMVVAGILLMVLLLTTIFGFTQAFTELPRIIAGAENYKMTIIGMGLLFGIPLLMMIIKGIKLLFNFKIKSTALNFAFLALWVIGWGITIYLGVLYFGNFTHKSAVTREYNIGNSTVDTLQISLIKIENAKEFAHFNINLNDDKNAYLLSNNSKFYVRDVMLKIEKSQDSSFHLSEIMSAYGYTGTDAKSNANEIGYEYNLEGKKLMLHSYCFFPLDKPWRKQKARLIIEVPEGKTIYLDKNMKHFLDDIPNVSDTYDEDMLGNYWKMTPEGLKCLNCSDEKPKEHRRHSRKTEQDEDYSS